MAEHVCSHSSNAGFGLVFTPFFAHFPLWERLMGLVFTPLLLTYPKKRDFGNGFFWFLITFPNRWAMYWLYSKDRLVSIIYVPYVFHRKFILHKYHDSTLRLEIKNKIKNLIYFNEKVKERVDLMHRPCDLEG